MTKGGERRVYPISLSHCLNWNISSHRILSSEWNTSYELPWFSGKYRSCSRSSQGEWFISKGVKVPLQKRVRPKASTTHLQVLTRKEADDVSILSGEKSTQENGVKNSDPVLVTDINKLIYLLYVLFPSLSSLTWVRITWLKKIQVHCWKKSSLYENTHHHENFLRWQYYTVQRKRKNREGW